MSEHKTKKSDNLDGWKKIPPAHQLKMLAAWSLLEEELGQIRENRQKAAAQRQQLSKKIADLWE
jgi:hypothetical protein